MFVYFFKMRKGTKARAAAEGDVTSSMAAEVVNDLVLTALSAGEVEAASDAALRPPSGADPVVGDRTVVNGGRRDVVSAPVGTAAGRGASRDGLSAGVGPRSRRSSVAPSADREGKFSFTLELLAAERAENAAERAASAAAMQRMLACMEEMKLQMTEMAAAGAATAGPPVTGVSPGRQSKTEALRAVVAAARGGQMQSGVRIPNRS